MKIDTIVVNLNALTALCNGEIRAGNSTLSYRGSMWASAGGAQHYVNQYIASYGEIFQIALLSAPDFFELRRLMTVQNVI